MSGTSGAQQRKTRITPRLSGISGAQQRKNTNYALLVGNFRGSAEKNMNYAPLFRNFRGSTKKNTDFAPLVRNFRGSIEKNMDYAPLVRNFRGSTEKNTNYAPLFRNFRAQTEKNVNYRAFRNVGYKKCRDAHRGKMFRLLWTFVDLKLPSAMSHAIHKIVSKERCQSYFILRRSPHLGISKDSESCASAHRCLHYAYALLCFRNFPFSYRTLR